MAAGSVDQANLSPQRLVVTAAPRLRNNSMCQCINQSCGGSYQTGTQAIMSSH